MPGIYNPRRVYEQPILAIAVPEEETEIEQAEYSFNYLSFEEVEFETNDAIDTLNVNEDEQSKIMVNVHWKMYQLK